MNIPDRNANGRYRLMQNRLLLYISEHPPGCDWLQLAADNNWELLHHADLMGALGAFIMLMPGVVIIDRSGALGNEALSHIEDVLPTQPQAQLLLVEQGLRDFIAWDNAVLRVGLCCEGPQSIPMRIQAFLCGAAY